VSGDLIMLTFDDRIKELRRTKIRHTYEKKEKQGYMDADDYGTVPLPDDFKFKPVSNMPDGVRFYGNDGFSRNFEALLSVHPVYVDPLEILCGRWRTMLSSYRFPWPQDLYPTAHLAEEQQLYGIISGIGADAHFAADYKTGLELGWGGLLEKIEIYKAINTPNDKNSKIAQFYEAETRVINSIQEFIRRHITEIRKLMSAETRPEILATLKKMIAANTNIIENPPDTFLEACQWISWYNCVSRIYNRDGAGCQLDVLLMPYYKKDIAAGILDRDEAVFILANLLLIETHYYQISGPDEYGEDMTCEVSWLILEACHKLNTSFNITIRIHDKIDRAFFRRAVEYLFTDRNGWPRFSGDPGLCGFMNNGYPLKDARDRIAVGCNWMAIPGREYTLNDCVKINCARVFDLAYHEMMDTGDGNYSLERLWDLFVQKLRRAVAVTAEGIQFHLAYQHLVEPELVMNLLTHNCIEKGCDVTLCAEQYNMCIDGVGLGTIADSFAALQQRITEEKLTDWDEVYQAVKCDFKGLQNERIRLMMSSAHRYCEGGGSAGDKWAKKISLEFARLVKDYPAKNGIKYIPGWFSWSNTIFFGKQVGATPNGRKAFTPVTHGANPTPGFRKDGAATAMINGIAAIQTGYGNTCPVQLELDPRLTVEEGGIEKVMTLIETHSKSGGTLLNINILDREKLMEAHRDPMLHPDLVVRVTGFTAYFAALSPEFRQLVIDRFIDSI
jgi:pyruvate-formate lyase